MELWWIEQFPSFSLRDVELLPQYIESKWKEHPQLIQRNSALRLSYESLELLKQHQGLRFLFSNQDIKLLLDCIPISQGPITESATLGEKFTSNSFPLVSSCWLDRVHDLKHLLDFLSCEVLASFFLKRCSEKSASAPEDDDVLPLLTLHFPMEKQWFECPRCQQSRLWHNSESFT